MLLADSAEPVAQDIRNAAGSAGVPLKLLDLRKTDLAKLYEAPLALIRPDQFVAWRGSSVDPTALVDTVRGIEPTTTMRRAAS